jgi:hypothetical protein
LEDSFGGEKLKDYQEEQTIQRALNAFQRLKERLNVSRLSTVILCTMKVLPQYLKKIRTVEKELKSKEKKIPKEVLSVIEDRSKPVSILLGTYYSTKSTYDLDMYFETEKLGKWYDPKNKWFVVSVLVDSCLRSAIPLASFLTVTMLETQISPFVGTISGTFELEDAMKLKGVEAHLIVEDNDISHHFDLSPCIYKMKGSFGTEAGIVLEDTVTPVMKAYWERVSNQKPLVVVAGTSGKYDRNSLVQCIKKGLQQDEQILYVNPQYKNTPIYTEAFVPLAKDNLVIPMDGEEFLLMTLLLRGVESHQIFPKEGLK